VKKKQKSRRKGVDKSLRTATEAQMLEKVWTPTKRRVTQADVERAAQRTDVEKQATDVDRLRENVSSHRRRISELENELTLQRAALSTAMMSHVEAVNKFKDMTALQNMVL
jgi:polyhydroxyalkanoate synthesis regulator phasin